MTQEEFKKEVTKQKRFINWMIKGRENISKKLDELANERYSHLIGKFFVLKENTHCLDKDELYFVSGIYTVSNYIGSSRIYVIVNLRTLSRSYYGNSDEIVGLSLWNRQGEFEIYEDLDRIIGDNAISPDDAYKKYINPYTSNLITTSFSIDKNQE